MGSLSDSESSNFNFKSKYYIKDTNLFVTICLLYREINYSILKNLKILILTVLCKFYYLLRLIIEII